MEDECLDSFAYYLLEYKRAVKKPKTDLQARYVEITKALSYIHGFKAAVSCLASNRLRKKIHKVYMDFMRVMKERFE